MRSGSLELLNINRLFILSNNWFILIGGRFYSGTELIFIEEDIFQTIILLDPKFPHNPLCKQSM